MKAIVITFLLLSVLLHAGDEQTRFTYRIVNAALAKGSLSGKPINIDAHTTIVYARERQLLSAEIFEVSSHIVLKHAGLLARDSKMDRTGIVFNQVDTERTRLAKNMLPSQQASYYKRYDTPFCIVQLDRDQCEVDRTYSTLEEHQPMDKTLVDNCQLLHAGLPSLQNRWVRTLSFMEAKGTLTYTKDGPPVDGRQKVKIEGTLENADKRMGNVPLGKESFVFNGTQIFDTKLNDYISGTFEIQTSMRYSAADGSKADMDGTMKVSIELQPGDPAKPK